MHARPSPLTNRSFGSIHDCDAPSPLSAPSDRWTRPPWAPPLSLCPQDGEDYANSINAIFLEASARTGANVQQIFDLAGALVVAALVKVTASAPGLMRWAWRYVRSRSSQAPAAAGSGARSDQVGHAD